jgi:hypothetical protein
MHCFVAFKPLTVIEMAEVEKYEGADELGNGVGSQAHLGPFS